VVLLVQATMKLFVVLRLRLLLLLLLLLMGPRMKIET